VGRYEPSLPTSRVHRGPLLHGAPSRPSKRTPTKPRGLARLSLILTAISLLLAQLPAPAVAQDSGEEASPRVSMSGFLSFSAVAQDRLFTPGKGQNAQVVAAVQDGPDGWWHTADVRNTRLLFHVDGGRVGEWQATGLLEMDLFGGFPSGESFDREQAYPRLRLAYLDLQRGPTRIRLGQDWAPLSHDSPESVNRLAFPPGWASSGVIGWRFPGVFLSHRIPFLEGSTLTFHGAAMRGDWIGDADDPERPSAGEATLVPQVEVAVELASQDGEWPWTFTVGGHADRKEAPAPTQASEPSGWAVSAHGRMEPGPWTILAGAYRGRAIGHLGGHVAQLADIRGAGAWIQAGYALPAGWSIWGFGGVDSPDSEDIGSGGILQNQTSLLMLRHDAGRFSTGLEWQHVRTDRWSDGVGSPRQRRGGNQLSLGVLLGF